VVAAADGCCPDHQQRIAQGFHVVDAYKERLRANLEALQTYGIHLVRADQLAHAVGQLEVAVGMRAAPGQALTPAPNCASFAAPAIPAVDTGVSPPLGKRVFSRRDALQCRESVFRLARSVLVTSLAADELRVRNIELIRT
jgi:hypothetical protein